MILEADINISRYLDTRNETLYCPSLLIPHMCKGVAPPVDISFAKSGNLHGGTRRKDITNLYYCLGKDMIPLNGCSITTCQGEALETPPLHELHYS